MVDDEIIREFLVESHEGLDRLDDELVALEASPRDSHRIASVFRTIHTIKGVSGFLGFTRLESLTHAGESLLSQLRDAALILDGMIVRELLSLVDRIREILKVVENTGSEPDRSHADLEQRLLHLAKGERIESAPFPTVVAVAEILPAEEIAAPQIDTPTTDVPAVTEAPPTSEGSSVADSFVRIDVTLLDTLMNLVGELVLSRNQIVQAGANVDETTFAAAAQRLDHITSELQEHVMKTRMQPIGTLWAKLPRIVRDLAASCHKHVHVEMFGKETELDRTLIEAIKDPLTHIVRNAVDHGLEGPDVRVAAGKPRTGTLALRAYHEGGQVNIEISDDGAGLNIDRIRAKAVERGLVTAERAALMSEREAGKLIFLPGFSTAGQVTNVSGRGVGMDVVLTNVERVGGTVDVSSTRGVGTTIKIRIPLTLAIVPALVIESSHERYAIPQANLVELVRIEPESGTSIEYIQGAPVYRLRGQLLPLVDLANVLGDTTKVIAADRTHSVVILAADDRSFGLVVDEVGDTEEIVVKPLGRELETVSIYAGATIMGDGRVALILDVLGLAEHAGVISRSRTQQQQVDRTAADDGAAMGDAKQALLLFGARVDETLAIPLSAVSRLEEMPTTAIERTGGRSVVQYRGQLLPLVDLRKGENVDPTLQIIVHTHGSRSVGFVVTSILDVVEEAIDVDATTRSAIVHGRATEVLDVSRLIRDHVPSFFEGAES
jgi:two-component system chemotaxis sensor kinase CheA